MKGKIYAIINKINKKVYIGQTTQTLSQRMYGHKYKAFTKKQNHPLYCSMRKYGLDNFSINLIEESIDVNTSEKLYIQKYNSIKDGYNIVEGGKNFKHSQITKNKLSKIAKNRFKNKKNHPLYNKKQSQEAKEKIRKSLLKYFENNENPFKDKKHSQKSLKIMKIKRNKRTFTYYKKWIVITPENKEIKIENLKKFCENNNLLYHSLKGVAHGTQKQHKGWKCYKVL